MHFSKEKRALYYLVAAVLFFFPTSFLFGQKVVISPGSEPSLNFSVDEPPVLKKLSHPDAREPYHEYLWIFGDGTFLNRDTNAAVSHAYGSNAVDEPVVVAYVTPVYSGGEEPPLRALPGDEFILKPSSRLPQPVGPTPMVDSASYLRLERNHPLLVPGDTTVWIYSLKYPQELAGSNAYPIGGNLFFFYDGPVTLKTELSDGSFASEVDLADPFEHVRTVNIYSDSESSPIHDHSINMEVDPGLALSGRFRNVSIFRFSNLEPGEERHLFIEMKNDESLADVLGDTTLLKKGESVPDPVVEFLAVMTVGDISNPINLSEEDEALLGELSFSRFIDLLNSPDSDNDDVQLFQTTGNIAPNVVDAFLGTAMVSTAHDPNYLKAQACECPADGEAGQMVVVKVHFENEGSAFASKAYIRVGLPSYIDGQRLPDTLLRSFPPNQEDNPLDTIRIERENDTTMLITMEGFLFETIKNDPDAFSEVVFTLFTRPDVASTDFEPLQACVAFGAPDGVQACTTPVLPTLLDPGARGEGSVLQCAACNPPPPDGGQRGQGGDGWGWLLDYLWFLLIPFLLLLFWLWPRFRRRSEE